MLQIQLSMNWLDYTTIGDGCQREGMRCVASGCDGDRRIGWLRGAAEGGCAVGMPAGMEKTGISASERDS